MGDSLNGGGGSLSSLQSSTETSPKTNQDNDGLWTPNVTLNGASRYAEGLNTSLATSTPNASYAANGGRRFEPRPSPERLQAQFKAMEKVVSAIQASFVFSVQPYYCSNSIV